MRSVLLLLASAALPLCAQVNIKQVSDRVIVEINGKPFTELITAADVPKPYLHPLRAASGTVVSRYYPMDLVEGESRDHPHHRGLWFTHGDVNGIDFWANEASYKGTNLGKVVLKRINDVKSGKKEGYIDATFEWHDPKGQNLITEMRRMTFYAEPDKRTIDIDILLRAEVPVKFGDTKEGTFAIRLASELEEPGPKSIKEPARNGHMVNAEGLTGEDKVWGKRSAWVDFSGSIKGEKLGVSILDHPSNPRYPTYWHARGYGLFASNIFGERDFSRDKARDGSLSLEPGQTLQFLFRVVIHPGDAQSADIAKMQQQFAKEKPLKRKTS